jgi:hypothetical protein
MKLISAIAVSFVIGVGLATAQTYTFTTFEPPTGESGRRLVWPLEVAIDDARNLYVVEFNSHSINRVMPGGSITTLAGEPSQRGSADGTGSAARFSNFTSLPITVDNGGNVLVAEPSNHTIRRVTPAGVVTTIAGLAGQRGSDDGVGSNARFNYPTGIAADRRGNVFVADANNHTIRMINRAGEVTTLAGLAGRWSSVDGVGSDARFSSPVAVTVDGEGNVYVASYDDTVRRVSPAGAVTTLAGLAGRSGIANGSGSEARFAFSSGAFDAHPVGIAMDHAGNVLVSDAGSGSIRRVTPEGVVTTVSQSVRLFWLAGLATHRSGELYIADSGNGRILKAVPESTLTITAAPQSQTIAPGSTVTFTTTAGGSLGVKYQWFKDGQTLTEATHSTLLIKAATEVDSGKYGCVVADVTGFTIETAAILSVVSSADAGRLVNFSIRSRLGASSPTLMMGATVAGPAQNSVMPVLVRAAGPSLARFGITDFLADPTLATSLGGAVVSSNDNWGGNPLTAASMLQVGAFEYLSPASLDAAIATALAPNTYHIQVNGKGGAAGMTLCEIFDATPAGPRDGVTPRLSNLAARHRIDAGGDVLIAGFSIGGQTAKTVLIRGVGPSLAALGVSDALANPVIQLFSGPRLLRENNDWGGDVQISSIAGSVHAFDLSGAGSKDAALLVTLPPGGYTLQVRSANGEAGVVLAEIFEVP